MSDITKEPSYHLYKFTSKLYDNKDTLLQLSDGERAVYGTLINRFYYSTYSFLSFWLEQQGESIKNISYYVNRNQRIKTGHKQVLEILKEKQLYSIHSQLFLLRKLREKADYKLYQSCHVGN